MTSGPVVLAPSPSLLTTHKSRDSKGPRLNHRLPRHITRKGLSTSATSEEGRQDIITARKTKRKGDQVHCPSAGDSDSSILHPIPQSTSFLDPSITPSLVRLITDQRPLAIRHWSQVLSSGPQPFWQQELVSRKIIFPRTGVGDGFRMIQRCYIYYVLYFYHYYISSTSGHLAYRSWRFMTLRQFTD